MAVERDNFDIKSFPVRPTSTHPTVLLATRSAGISVCSPESRLSSPSVWGHTTTTSVGLGRGKKNKRFSSEKPARMLLPAY
ncbi:hypothetical protein EYF80_032720 [Liparis tanakae]|uniref:Uncharacterized protein n=1 Tax=Liparis tanakae TaxID=230148 RepID=A0A4Z2GVD5_9TELE|nr:hypothetical protein EYF80_032720 [Liparis tanakae]